MDEIVGHQWAVEMFKRARERGRVSHGYLLVGPPHIGKRTLLRVVAKMLLCANFLKDDHNPSQCSSCTALARNIHPDFIEISSGDSGNRIPIDAVRRMRDFLYRRPILGFTSVCIIPRAEMLGEEARQALLKILEEPPPSAILLLASPASELLPPTITSRLITLRLTPVNEEELAQALLRRGAPADEAQMLARASCGLPGLAFSWSADPKIPDSTAFAKDLASMPLWQRVKYIREMQDKQNDLAALWETMGRLLHIRIQEAILSPSQHKDSAAEVPSALCRQVKTFLELNTILRTSPLSLSMVLETYLASLP